MCEGEVKFISIEGRKKKEIFYICLHSTDEPIRTRQFKVTISEAFLLFAVSG